MGCHAKKQIIPRIIYFEFRAGTVLSLGNNTTEDMSFVMAQTQSIGRIELMESGHLENQGKSEHIFNLLFNTDRHLYYK